MTLRQVCPCRFGRTIQCRQAGVTRVVASPPSQPARFGLRVRPLMVPFRQGSTEASPARKLLHSLAADCPGGASIPVQGNINMARTTHVTHSIAVALTLLTALATARQPAAAADSVYELRIYTCEPGKLDALHERFRKHTMRLFEKHGMENVGYWTPTDEPRSANTLVYLLRHGSRDAAKASWKAFLDDPEWKTVAEESRRKDGKILAMPPVSVYLMPTDYSPAVQSPQRDRLYELRIYSAAPGKLEALHARFRDHTDRLFARHGLAAYAYWKPVDPPHSESTMYYILVTPNRDRAKESWKAFAADPEWNAARTASEANGSLLAHKPDSMYLKLTDYSPAR